MDNSSPDNTSSFFGTKFIFLSCEPYQQKNGVTDLDSKYFLENKKLDIQSIARGIETDSILEDLFIYSKKKFDVTY